MGINYSFIFNLIAYFICKVLIIFAGKKSVLGNLQYTICYHVELFLIIPNKVMCD